MEEESRCSGAYIPDDLVVEILARLPAKSLCRFKCISRSWHDLITDPAHRCRLAQTLCGFFFSRPIGCSPSWSFASLSKSPPPGVDTALSFLPQSCGKIELLDSCNGLLLLRCSGAPKSPLPPFYVVCNPATGESVALPKPSLAPFYHGYSYKFGNHTEVIYAALGFDPAVSSHFHVFQLVEVAQVTQEFQVEAVEIYSSETGKWILRESRWSERKGIIGFHHMTYLNGFMHFATNINAVALVDTSGQSWRIIRTRPHGDHGNIHYFNYLGASQGQLLYIDWKFRCDHVSVYVLEDHHSEKWTFKQSINDLSLFKPLGSRGQLVPYRVAGCQPNGDLIFFYDGTRGSLISYDMDKRDVNVICTLREVDRSSSPFLPYIPLYARVLASSRDK